MAVPKDFTTLIRQHGLRADCESCHYLAGTQCPKHERPDRAPESDGICADWIDAETFKSVTGKRRLCRVCNVVKCSNNVSKTSVCYSCIAKRDTKGKPHQRPSTYMSRLLENGLTMNGKPYKSQRCAQKARERLAELNALCNE